MLLAGRTKPSWLIRWPSSLRQTAPSMTRARWSSEAPPRMRSRSGVSCSENRHVRSRQPNAVAGRAERLGDRRDEADAARSAVREPEVRRRAGSVGRRGREREQVLDPLLDAEARHHQVVGPDLVPVQGHELDEPDLVALL